MDHQPSPSSSTTNKNNMKMMITTKHPKEPITISTLLHHHLRLLPPPHRLPIPRTQLSKSTIDDPLERAHLPPSQRPKSTPLHPPQEDLVHVHPHRPPDPRRHAGALRLPLPTPQPAPLHRSRRAYALAGAAAVGGLTFVADSFYDYENPWHGLNALAGFFSWMAGSACARPARLVLFKNGEAVGRWIAGVLKAGLGV